jgi:hypothetical protein
VLSFRSKIFSKKVAFGFLSLFYFDLYSLTPPFLNTELENFNTSSINSSITINGASITNTGEMGIGILKINILSGTLSNTGTLGYLADSIVMTGGSVFNLGSGFIAPYLQHSLTISSNGYLSNDPSCHIGPAQLALTNGYLINNGLISLDCLTDTGSWVRQAATSSFTGGSCTGSGEIWISGYTSCSIPITQGTIIVGEGFDTSNLSLATNTSGILFIENCNINATISVTGSGSLQGQGSNSYSAQVLGDVYPGLNNSTLGDLNINGNISFVGENSSLKVAINNVNSNLLIVGGTLSFDNSSQVIISSIINAPKNLYSYTISSFSSFSGTIPQLVNNSQYGDIFSLELLPNDLILKASFPKNISVPTGCCVDAATTATILNLIDGNCPAATQNIYNLILTLSPDEQLAALNALSPNFKKIQFSLEKLDLLLHKELEIALYAENSEPNLFLIGGYDYLTQNASCCYDAYRINSFYQMAVFTWNFSNLKTLWGLGAAESYLTITPLDATAQYTTGYATVGVSSEVGSFQAGLDTLFGYSYIKGSSPIAFLDQTAINQNGAWNLSVDGRLSYSFKKSNSELKLYDQIGYNYGFDNSYTEYNTQGADLVLKSSHISVFRNAIGFIYKLPKDYFFPFFLDTSWLYEDYLSGENYQAAFKGTSVYGTYTDKIPKSNYLRFHTGLEGSKNHFQWQLAYTYLQGSGFLENSVSVKLGYKF